MRISECGTALVLLLVIVLVVGERADAQTIVLKTGQRVETNGVRRSGDKVMGKIEVAGTAGEVGHDVSAIAKIEFPEPQGIKRAAESLSQGDAERALADINPIITFYESFRDIPGAWWAPAAVIKVSALAALQRDLEAEPLAAAIQKNATDPETARAANLRIASSLLKRQEYDKAAQICDAAIKESTRPDVLADAWVTKGNVLLAQKQWDAALLAFLRVPVFYRDERLYMPQALLGSARAYRRLEDKERAKKTLDELIAGFPKSAEAATAKTELQKL
ncbi:MAG TPA: tetratricopeptide repeat protein [Chthoniobacterales bacterium]|nr:tetratricopeptide repeat protein [Chthoniobacterales bacterium]